MLIRSGANVNMNVFINANVIAIVIVITKLYSDSLEELPRGALVRSS